LALAGGLDFVNGRFVDVSVATIEAGGCARVRQAMHGSFAHPVLEKPRMFTSLAGPVLHVYRQLRAVLPARPCAVFYSGSVPAPG
jgi:AsmA protein